MFAQSLRNAGVALGIGGLLEDPRLKDPVDYRAPVVEIGGSPAKFLHHFPTVLRSLESIDRAAAGHGVLTSAVVIATCSTPRRDRTNARVRTSSRTRSVNRSATSEDAARRTGAPFSPPPGLSGGSHSASVTSP